MCRSDHELHDVQERSNDIVTYAQSLGQFEELLCVVVLTDLASSAPIDHPHNAGSASRV
jgi:hypothetical protein